MLFATRETNGGERTTKGECASPAFFLTEQQDPNVVDFCCGVYGSCTLHWPHEHRVGPNEASTMCAAAFAPPLLSSPLTKTGMREQKHDIQRPTMACRWNRTALRIGGEWVSVHDLLKQTAWLARPPYSLWHRTLNARTRRAGIRVIRAKLGSRGRHTPAVHMTDAGHLLALARTTILEMRSGRQRRGGACHLIPTVGALAMRSPDIRDVLALGKQMLEAEREEEEAWQNTE